MILVINNSNRNTEIKKYLKNSYISNKIKNPHFKKSLKKFKNGKNLNLSSKKSSLTLKFVTDKLLYILDTLKVNYKNIVSLDDLLDVIKSNTKVTGIILSGSDLRLSLNIPYKLLTTNAFAIEYFKDVPIFGICFGFQFINQYYGGEIGKAANFTNKTYRIAITKPGWFFKKNHSGVYKFFNADIVSALGKGFMSKTNYYDNEGLAVIVEHKTKKIIGTQFHPEISGNAGIKIIKDFCSLCDAEALSH